MRRRALLAVVLAVACACGRERSRFRPEPPPPDLASGKTGGATALRAARAFAFVPEDAVAVGVLDPSALFGAAGWVGRAPGLAKVGAAVTAGGFNPTKSRIFFFALPGAGEPSVAAVIEGKLSAIPGGRLERRGEAEIRWFDGERTAVAWVPGVTLVGSEPALGRALAAGRKEGALASSLGAYREVFDHLPVVAMLRLAWVRSPLVTAFVSRWAAPAPRVSLALASLLRLAGEVPAAGAAVYAHGARVHLALVLRASDAAAARALAEGARRAVRRGRAPAGGVARAPEEALLAAALAAVTVRERGPTVLIETAIGAELLAKLFR